MIENTYYTKGSFIKVNGTNAPALMNRKITASEGVVIKVNNEPKNNKEKLFYDLIKWFDNYNPDKNVDRIKFKLQGTVFNVVNEKKIIVKWFRNLQKLSLKHFDNWNINKFIIN